MLLIIGNILYVLIALAMTVLILLQRGAGADAGSGFGGGASATVFGARGSANFLSRSTAVLAGLFFLLSLGMGMYLGRRQATVQPNQDLGVMGQVVTSQEKAATGKPATAPTGDVPKAAGQPEAATGSSAPAAKEASPGSDVPKASGQPDGKPQPKDGGKH
ncbi:MAG: preprotein translocase subunit SecG [Lysobacterales bacterium]